MAFWSDDTVTDDLQWSRTDLTKTIEIDSTGENTTLSVDQTRKSQPLATTIANTMWLWLEEMQKTFSWSFRVRDDFDPHASQRISMNLVTFAKDIAEKRKPMS